MSNTPTYGFDDLNGDGYEGIELPPECEPDISDEDWEECVRGALSDEQMYPRDPYLQGGHYEANEHTEGESW